MLQTLRGITMGAIFSSGDCIWGQELEDIFSKEPYIYMDPDLITLSFDRKGNSLLLMPSYYNDKRKLLITTENDIF